MTYQIGRNDRLRDEALLMLLDPDNEALLATLDPAEYQWVYEPRDQPGTT